MHTHVHTQACTTHTCVHMHSHMRARAQTLGILTRRARTRNRARTHTHNHTHTHFCTGLLRTLCARFCNGLPTRVRFYTGLLHVRKHTRAYLLCTRARLHPHVPYSRPPTLICSVRVLACARFFRMHACLHPPFLYACPSAPNFSVHTPACYAMLCTHTHTRARMHASVHNTYTHIHVRTRIHKYTHVHTQ